MPDSRSFIDDLIYGKGSTRRYMQSSPILYDVWSGFATKPWKKQDLLLTPYRGTQPGELCKLLRDMLPEDRKIRPRAKWRGLNAKEDDIAYNQADVAALLSFPETIRVILPLTGWWTKEVHSKLAKGKLKDPLIPFFRNEKDRLVLALKAFREGTLKQYRDLTPDIIWLVQMIGSLAILRKHTDQEIEAQPPEKCYEDKYYKAEAVVDAVEEIMKDLVLYKNLSEELSPKIHVVNCNRAAETSIERSTRAIKADAALRLFEINCSRLKWAIIDSGIDAQHEAFKKSKNTGNWAKDTRVRETYDFSFIRHLLSPSKLHSDNPGLPARLQDALTESQKASTELETLKAEARLAERAAKKTAEPPQELTAEDKAALKKAASLQKKKAIALDKKKQVLEQKAQLFESFNDLKRALLRGRDLDWSLLRPFLEIPYDDTYKAPRNDHGTHVGGILAAGGEDAEKFGVCPDINLVDFRVLDDKGKGHEFNVIAALQFIRYINGSEDYMVIQGANLSLSINHDVANYACGRTPVCDEADRLASSGVCVVTAAGNKGYIKYHTSDGPREGYHTISITDPGNAEKVITVGATHRYRPHTYGVSYFSSRGPTGDGRLKPDLVAPGEKIKAPAPDNEWRVKDGTSMAAPHVSGAAALLMARHREMVGRPEEIKRILCETATDLGRERYFQGNGMLDILRALQSV